MDDSADSDDPDDDDDLVAEKAAKGHSDGGDPDESTPAQRKSAQRTSEEPVRVFISSTYEDLKQYRRAAAEACLSLGHLAVGMEDFSAEDERPVEKTLAEVAKADIYLGIVAWRYGYIPPGRRHPENLSITDLEYREARENGKPCLIFMITEDTPWPPKFFDSDSEKIIQFRRELQGSNIVYYFSSIDDFRAHVVQVLAALKPRFERSPERASFDAFLSYNSSSDNETVQAIAKKLIRDGVRVWMDVISTRPGDKWEGLWNDALSRATTVVAFVGPNGVGPGQRVEIDQMIRRQAQDAEFRLIPVLLPGAHSKVPSDLRPFRWIPFSSLDDPTAYSSLHSAIRPAANSPSVTRTEVFLNYADLELLTDLLFRVVARLRERPEMLSSLDGATFWAQVRKIAPQTSTPEDLRKLKEELSSVPGPGPLWSAWTRNTRAAELAALMRNAAPAEAKLS